MLTFIQWATKWPQVLACLRRGGHFWKPYGYVTVCDGCGKWRDYPGFRK